jgi:hypothetical protein
VPGLALSPRPRPLSFRPPLELPYLIVRRVRVPWFCGDDLLLFPPPTLQTEAPESQARWVCEGGGAVRPRPRIHATDGARVGVSGSLRIHPCIPSTASDSL